MLIVFSGKALRRRLIKSKSAVGMNDVFDRKWGAGPSSGALQKEESNSLFSDPVQILAMRIQSDILARQ